MGAGEGAKLLVGDALFVGEVDAAEGALDPDVDGESAVESAGEEQDTIGDLLADAGEFYQLLQCAVIIHSAQCVEIELAAIDQASGVLEVLNPEAEFAVPELLVGGAGDGGDGREGVVVGIDRLTESLGQEADDLADLDDLFSRTGDERGETFPRFLAEDAEAMMVANSLVEQGIIRECGEDCGEGEVERQIMDDGGGETTLTLTLSRGGRGESFWVMLSIAHSAVPSAGLRAGAGRRYRRHGSWPRKSFAATIPLECVIELPEMPELVADDADEPAIGLTVPAKRLTAFQCGGEREIRNVD